jgi:iron(III) transport system ATP-binding protein
VDAASLSLAPGSITALLGKSGAGKSTLLRLIAGLERPDQGTIKIGGELLSDPKIMIPAEKRRIGLIFQDFALFPHLTALENIQFGLSGIPKNNRKALAKDWLERIGLGTRSVAYPHQLSGGEQQRVAIARALAPEPVAILMDEPFSGLDPALREDLRDVALAAVRASQIPALLVTHDAHEAMVSADHLAVMRDGKIVQEGPPETVYTQPVDKEVATALGPLILLNGRAEGDETTVNTAFGPVEKPRSGEKHMIGVRPEAVLIDPLSPVKAIILANRRSGPLRQLQIEAGGVKAVILVPASAQAAPGQQIGIRLDPSACIVF